jgi:hypothetical protein
LRHILATARLLLLKHLLLALLSLHLARGLPLLLLALDLDLLLTLDLHLALARFGLALHLRLAVDLGLLPLDLQLALLHLGLLLALDLQTLSLLRLLGRTMAFLPIARGFLCLDLAAARFDISALLVLVLFPKLLFQLGLRSFFLSFLGSVAFLLKHALRFQAIALGFFG